MTTTNTGGHTVNTTTNIKQGDIVRVKFAAWTSGIAGTLVEVRKVGPEDALVGGLTVRLGGQEQILRHSEVELVPSFSKAEARRRLRSIVAELKDSQNFPRSYRGEVGHRLLPRAGSYDELVDFPDQPGDDLRDFSSIDDAVLRPDARVHGAELHIYISSTGTWGELISVCRVWLGTPDEAPRILGTDG